MANEVLVTSSSGCPTILANGAVGTYLGIGPTGAPTYLVNPGGPSSDAGNAALTGSDGKVYISCEEIQDCIGAAIAAGTGLVYNDVLNSISGALKIPISSGNGAPAATVNSPTIYTDNVTGNIYYRDQTGATILIGISGGQTPFAANDSSTIDFTASGVANHTLTGSVINDPAGGLTSTASGEAVKIDPASTAGAVTLSASGLNVTLPTLVGIVNNDVNTDTTAGAVVKAKLAVDPSVCNSLTNSGAGWYSHKPTYQQNDTAGSNIGAIYDGFGNYIEFTAIPANNTVGSTNTLSITNTDPCNPALIFIDVGPAYMGIANAGAGPFVQQALEWQQLTTITVGGVPLKTIMTAKLSISDSNSNTNHGMNGTFGGHSEKLVVPSGAIVKIDNTVIFYNASNLVSAAGWSIACMPSRISLASLSL